MEFYNLLTLVNSKIKDGHSMVLPSEEAGNYFKRNGKFFPFYIAILNNRLYVNMNCSADTSIKDGSEILNINGIDTRDILKYLLKRQIRDGNSQTYPIWILTNYFKEYFSFSYGHPDTFSISCKTGKADCYAKTISALPKDSISFYRKLKYAKRNSVLSENQGISLQTNKQLSIATLTIKSFDPDILKSLYEQDFDSTINQMFSQIYTDHIQNLILDLRNNQGGDFKTGKLLLSYLLRQTIKYLPYCSESETLTPKQNSYKGKLFVLTNGGSFSSTAILCSYLETTKRATFIGDETAGNKITISGNVIDTILPNTKIAMEVSTTKYVIKKGHNLGRGVIPNYYTVLTIEDIITDKDIAKELALSLISKEENN